MSIRTITAMAGTAFIMGAAAIAFSSPASALTMKECSTKYQAAKDAGTLGNMKWNDFRKARVAMMLRQLRRPHLLLRLRPRKPPRPPRLPVMMAPRASP